MKLTIKAFISKCDQFRSLLRIWSHLLRKSLMENYIIYITSDYLHYYRILTTVI